MSTELQEDREAVVGLTEASISIAKRFERLEIIYRSLIVFFLAGMVGLLFMARYSSDSSVAVTLFLAGSAACIGVLLYLIGTLARIDTELITLQNLPALLRITPSPVTRNANMQSVVNSLGEIAGNSPDHSGAKPPLEAAYVTKAIISIVQRFDEHIESPYGSFKVLFLLAACQVLAAYWFEPKMAVALYLGGVAFIGYFLHRIKKSTQILFGLKPPEPLKAAGPSTILQYAMFLRSRPLREQVYPDYR